MTPADLASPDTVGSAPPVLLPAALSLSGAVAIVTGAGSAEGIGFAAARALGTLGASLVVASTTDRIHERAADLSQLHVSAVGFVGDLTADEVPGDLVALALDRFGRLDIVVNNAGMTSIGAVTPSATTWPTMDGWRDGMRRDLDTAYAVSRAAAPHLGQGGRIVNIASVTGPLMAMRGQAQYAAAKAGMVGLTRALALDLAAQRVTVNAVLPGWIDTASQDADEAVQGMRTPLGRSGTADEIAWCVAWLAGSGAAYLTGQMIVIDGGNSIAEQRS